jgi:hypothetical protein
MDSKTFGSLKNLPTNVKHTRRQLAFFTESAEKD